MNTDNSTNDASTDKVTLPRHPARPFLLTAAGLLFVFGIFFLLLFAGGSGGGFGNGSGGAGDSGDGKGSSLSDYGPGAGKDGTGKGFGESGDGLTAGKTADSPGTGDKPAADTPAGSGAQTPGGDPETEALASSAHTVSDAPPSGGAHSDAPPIHVFSAPSQIKLRKTEIKSDRVVLRNTNPDAKEIASAVAGPATGSNAGMSGTGIGGGGGTSGKIGKIGLQSPGFFGLSGIKGNALFIVDVSGSMATMAFEETRIEILKYQLKKVIKEEAEKTSGKYKKFAIVAFSSGTQMCPSSGTILFNSNRKKVNEFIDNLAPGGGTDLHGAFKDAMKIIKANSIQTIFLLTDGEPDDRWHDTLPYIKKNIPKEMIINTIAIGMKSREMELIAKNHYGKYREIQTH